MSHEYDQIESGQYIASLGTKSQYLQMSRNTSMYDNASSWPERVSMGNTRTPDKADYEVMRQQRVSQDDISDLPQREAAYMTSLDTCIYTLLLCKVRDAILESREVYHRLWKCLLFCMGFTLQNPYAGMVVQSSIVRYLHI